MRVSLIKSKNDEKVFKTFKSLGFDVFEIEDLNKTDKEIEKLINQNYDTIILTNEVASFSEDIIKKYQRKGNKDNINIIIAPSRIN